MMMGQLLTWGEPDDERPTPYVGRAWDENPLLMWVVSMKWNGMT